MCKESSKGYETQVLLSKNLVNFVNQNIIASIANKIGISYNTFEYYYDFAPEISNNDDRSV